MSTETNINIDLDHPAVSAFIGAAERKLIDPDYEDRKNFVLKSGFRETAAKRIGPLFDPDDHLPDEPDSDPPSNGVVGIVAAEIKTYDLFEPDASGRFTKFVSKVETQLVHAQDVRLAIWHQLFVTKGLSKEEQQRFETLFRDYQFDDVLSPEPNDYASDNDMPASQYEALAYFELNKVGDVTIHDAQDKAIRSYYSSGENEGKYQLVYVGSRFEEVRERDDGAYEVQNPESDSTVNDIVDEIIGPGPAETCEGFGYKNERIATLISYPEFKVVWRRVNIKIGCVRISLKLPQLWYRNNKRVLHGVVAYSLDASEVVEKVIVHCLKSAALKGTLVGLVTANPKLGAAAFKAAFRECVLNQLLQYLKCLFPELVVLKEIDGWKPV